MGMLNFSHFCLLPRFKMSGQRPNEPLGKSQTYYRQESSRGRIWASLRRRSRDGGRRVPFSSGTSTTIGSNKKSLCVVVSWTPSLLGEMQTMGVTVPQFEISSGVCSRFNPWVGPLLPFWQMDPSLPGVMQAMVVTVRQFNVNSGLFSPLVYADL